MNPLQSQVQSRTQPHSESATETESLPQSQEEPIPLPTNKNQPKRKRDIPRVWTHEEDERLRLAVSVHGTSRWKRISLDVGRRTGDQCCQRWMRALCPDIKKGRWTPDEDALLYSRIRVLGEGCWQTISTGIPGRTDIQCRSRWLKTVRKRVIAAPQIYDFIPGHVPSANAMAQNSTSNQHNHISHHHQHSTNHNHNGPQYQQNQYYRQHNHPHQHPQNQDQSQVEIQSQSHHDNQHVSRLSVPTSAAVVGRNLRDSCQSPPVEKSSASIPTPPPNKMSLAFLLA